MKCPNCQTKMIDGGSCGEGRLFVCPSCGNSLCTQPDIRHLIKEGLEERVKQSERPK